MKKYTISLLLATILAITCIGQKYTSDSVIICRPTISTGQTSYRCTQYPTTTYIRFSPISNPEKMDVYFPITKETSTIDILQQISNNAINDSTKMIFFEGKDRDTEDNVALSVRVEKGKVVSVGVESRSSLIIFLIKE